LSDEYKRKYNYVVSALYAHLNKHHKNVIKKSMDNMTENYCIKKRIKGTPFILNE